MLSSYRAISLFSLLLLTLSGCGSAVDGLNANKSATSDTAFSEDDDFPLTGQTITSVDVNGTPQHLWNMNSGAEVWNSKIGLGDGGREAVVLRSIPFVAYQYLQQRFSGHNDTATSGMPTAQWSTDILAGIEKIAAAKNARAYAYMRRIVVGSSNRLIVSWYRNGQTVASEYEIPAGYITIGPPSFGLRLSADGKTTVAWTQKGNDLHLFTFQNGSITPRIDTFGSANNTSFVGDVLDAAMTPNGKFMAIQNGTRILILDVTTGQKLFYDVTWQTSPTSRIAISDDGNTVVRTASDFANGIFFPSINRYVRQGNTYVLALFPGATNGAIAAFAASSDAKTLAYTVGLGSAPSGYMNKSLMRVVDMSNGFKVVYDELIETAGTLSNLATAVRMTDDGRLVAFGFTGDNLPELHVVKRFPSGQYFKILSYDTAGSIDDLALANNGNLLVTSRGTHFSYNQIGNDNVDLFALEPLPPTGGTDDLFLDGTVGVGQPVTLRMTGGTPNKMAFFLMATSLTYPPVIYGNQQGFLYLDPTMLKIIGRGTFNANGVATITIMIPGSVPPGTKWYIQGNKERVVFSNNYLTLDL